MKLPDGPQLPALLQTLAITAQPIKFLETCASRYGDMFTLRVLGNNSPPVIFLSHPDAIQAVFTHLSDAFELGKVTHVFRPLVGERSLIMQEGQQHQRQRHLLMPALHRDRLEQQGELICHLAESQISQWQVGQSLCPRTQMSEISLQVILHIVFGIEGGDRYYHLKHLLTHLLESITSPLYSTQFFFPQLQKNWGRWSPWGTFLRQRQQIDAAIYAEIAERRSQQIGNRTDILSLLLTARDDQGDAMSDQELRDQLMTLLLLGHETTASALTWALYWLHQQPKCLAKLLHELEGVNNPTAIAQLPYLTAVCKEALRVYPIALIAQPRKVKRSIQLNNYIFTPGTVLIPCIYLAHRRDATYENPAQFCPERFVSNKFSPYEFFPFGGGSRSCIGMALSLLEMKLILATVVSRWKLRSNQDAVRPARRGITFVPPAQFRLTVEKPRPALRSLSHLHQH